jgi:hypothetical protein
MEVFRLSTARLRGGGTRFLFSQLIHIFEVTAIMVLIASVPARAWFAGFAPPQLASGAGSRGLGAPDATPQIVAEHLGDGETIRLDGRLDDPAWNAAEAGSGFRMWDPERGAAGHQNTVFKVAYDDNSIYFAVACAESDPGQITKKLARRDRPTDSDGVRVYIDPYHDRSTGYFFEVNPLGVQGDGYVYNDGEIDQDWDAVWQAETFEDRDGWYAELRVPLSSIRYRADASTWGLNVFREIHSKGETDAWTVWDRETAGFVSRFGLVTGIENIPAPKQIELLPYAVARATDPSTSGPEDVDKLGNFGLDLKCGVTTDLVLNATIQPDFGQVEADPAVLNLSPFETFYQEKRPFFTEGSRYYQNPSFNQFYSRRIGTGDDAARIRAASKLTGKTKSGVSIGVLAASTDITEHGQSHNAMRSGFQQSNYFIGRVGKESANGLYSFNLMQTAVTRPGSRERYGNMGSREAYTTGGDFSLLLKDRKYGIQGTFVGSVIDPEPLAADPTYSPSKSYGTGGDLNISRRGGTWRGSIDGRWLSDRLDLNDAGYLRSPDHVISSAWIGYMYNPTEKKGIFSNAQLNYNLNLGWLYASRTGYDIHTGERAWSYGRGHEEISSTNVNGWGRFRNFYEMNAGFSYQLKGGTQRYDTRSDVVMENGLRAPIPGGGALIGEPETYTFWVGASSDSRKDLVAETNYNYSFDAAQNLYRSTYAGVAWNQSSAFRHQIGVSYETRTDDTQHIDNYESLSGGVGGVSYVYGDISQRTLDVVLRTNLLFSRSQSIEIYAQPYLTNGSYTDPRRLTRADSYELEPFAREGFNVKDYDFRFASVNLNAVYRWEYRPGSTLFLVWTHSRIRYDERDFSADPASFSNGLSSESLFKNEPENVLLAKITYWFPL